MSARLALGLVLLGGLAAGCGAERVHAPVRAPAPRLADAARASEEPYPDTAFQGAPPRPVAPRRIGPAPEERERPRFTGALVDLDVKNVEVHDALRLLAEVGKVNLVVAGDVTGTITLRLVRVPWDQALDVIARVRGLSVEREGNVILVRPSGPAARAGNP